MRGAGFYFLPKIVCFAKIEELSLKIMDIKSQTYNKEFIKNLSLEEFRRKLQMCQENLTRARAEKEKLQVEKTLKEKNYELPNELDLMDERIALEDSIISDLEEMIALFKARAKKDKLL